MTTEEQRLMRKIGDILLGIGFSPHMDGYHYLRTGMKHCKNDPTLPKKLTQGFYVKVAQDHNVSSQQVARCIRSAIEAAWNKDSLAGLNDMFRVKVINKNDKPKNVELIALLAEWLKFEFDDCA